MKISKQSWHYRLVNDSFTLPSNNLCTYVWQIIVSLIFWLIFIMFVSSAAFIIASGLAVFVLPHFVDVWGYEGHWRVKKLIELVMVFGALFWIVCAGFSISYLWGFLIDKLITDRREGSFKSVKSRKPSIVSEYIKAKKQKICPMIEFEGKP